MTADVERLAAAARLTGAISQATFRALMLALAEPGTVHRLPVGIDRAGLPGPIWLALALADVDTPVHVSGQGSGDWSRLIATATGAPLVTIGQARIVCVTDRCRVPDGVPLGTADSPEAGALVSLPVTGLVSGPEPAAKTGPETDGGSGPLNWLTLTGPGVPGRRLLGVRDAPPDLVERVGRASGRFPAGFDLWLVTPDGSVAAIPRSATVTTPGTTDRTTATAGEGGVR